MSVIIDTRERDRQRQTERDRQTERERERERERDRQTHTHTHTHTHACMLACMLAIVPSCAYDFENLVVAVAVGRTVARIIG